MNEPSLKSKTIRELKNFDLILKKEKGQHFLVEENYLKEIVRSAELSPEDNVIEIGAGTGILTNELAKTGALIIAIEKDRTLIPPLEKKLKGYTNVKLIQKDFKNIILSEITKEYNGNWKVVANLPYCITNYIIISLLENKELFKKIILTVQLEVAERLIALPGNKLYGAITLFTNYHSEVSILNRIPAGAFFPPPKVRSAIIKIIPREKPPVTVKNEKNFFTIIRSAFNMRRKTLRNSLIRSSLSNLSPEDVDIMLKKADIDGQRRGETLSMEEFALLSCQLEEKIC